MYRINYDKQWNYAFTLMGVMRYVWMHRENGAITHSVYVYKGKKLWRLF